MADVEILEPGQNIRPKITFNEAKGLVKKLYGFHCKSISELNGYDDKNFKVIVQDDHQEKKVSEYVLKILNSLDSKKVNFIEAQNEMLLFVSSNNINCPIPIKTVEGIYYSVQQLESGLHIVRLMHFLPGLILMKAPEISPSLIIGIGRFVGNLDTVLENFMHPVYLTHKSLWMLESVPELKKFMFAIDDVTRRSMLEEIVSEFEDQVLKKTDTLAKGMIHGDFNEQNILVENVENEWQIRSILDFGDTQYSCYLFELAVTMTYVMILKTDVGLGGYVLKGFAEVRELSDVELNLLKICIEARVAQSLTMGAYSSKQDPGNSYVLSTSKPGWELLLKLRSMKNEDLVKSWRKLIEL